MPGHQARPWWTAFPLVTTAFATLLLLGGTAVACGGETETGSTPANVTPVASAHTEDASPSPADPPATDTTSARVRPTSPTTAIPDSARAMEHIRYLSEDIGPRPAGSEAEEAAAAYIASQLGAAGYETRIEDFDFQAPRDDSLVTLSDGQVLGAIAMRGSPNAEVSALATHGGLGRHADLAGADLDGRIVIFDRGEVTFGDKARAAEAGGAVGVIIVNNEPGPLLGALGDVAVSIPVLAVAGEIRDALTDAIGQTVTMRTDSRIVSTSSQNVIGRRGDECHGYLGAHYDSVSISPGANDNASGTAVVLEIARVNPVDGLCVVLFGAEELGLFGSQHYVSEHLAGTARFMMNVDMAGRNDGPAIIGDADLTRTILLGLRTAGVETMLRAGNFPPGASSDHVSFASVGVAAVTFNAGDDAAIHTPQDTIDRIERPALGMFLAAVDAALDELVATHPGAFAR